MAKLLVGVMLVLFSFISHADEHQWSPDSKSKSNLSNEELAQRGCCSHHGGVCGCSGGQDVCCDGDKSPSCGCHSEDVKEFLKFEEPERPKS